MILYVTDRNIRVDNADNQISYNSDYIAEFHFDDEWNGKIKTARFVQNGEYVDVVLVDDRCDIPPLKTGFVRVGVFTDSMTSTYVDVYFKTSIKDGSGNPTEPPEDVYAQLTALIESGMLKGEDGLTPYVGENNNWWIGDVDTGILARGTDGHTPVKGKDYFTESEIRQIQNEVSEGAIGDFKQVVDDKTNKFDANAESKLNAYDANAESKLSAYNQNDSQKTSAYNQNADSKFTAYNENADNRIAEFDSHTEQIQTEVDKLKSDLDEQKKTIYLERWDISKGADAELLDKTYLLASATTLEDSKASHDNFFTVVIKVNPNSIYYGFDEYLNSQVAGRFAGRIWFYDSNKNALSTISNPVDSVTTPDNCEYVAFFCNYTDKTTQTTGEYWFTDKEPNERKDRIVLCDKLDLSQIDLEAGEGLKITGNKISIIDSASESLKEVILKRFPTLPYKVYRDSFGGFVVEDILSNRNESFTTYYVDCENGLDTNNGTSRTSAYKTLKQAFSKYATSNQHCIIQIIGNNPIFYSDDLYGELLVKKSLVIKSESKAKIICGIKPTFTTHNEYENVYVSNDLSGNNFTYCLNIDDSNHDNMGLYKPMTKVSSIALVDTTSNSYFIENGVIYSSVNTLVALLNGYRWRFNHTLSTESHILYEENLNVIGALFYASRSAKSDDEKIIERVTKDCIYQHNVSGDGVPFSDYDVAYSINTKCGYTKADCFNHHASFSTEEQILNGVAIEVNCESEEAGFYRPSRTYTDNLFTAHEGINIARFNIGGNHSDGPMVADVNGCRTIIVRCDVLNTKYDYTPSNNKGCFEFNNKNAVHDGFVSMQDCRGFDNRTNFKTLVSTVDTEINNCDVYNSFECDNLTIFNERI